MIGNEKIKIQTCVCAGIAGGGGVEVGGGGRPIHLSGVIMALCYWAQA